MISGRSCVRPGGRKLTRSGLQPATRQSQNSDNLPPCRALHRCPLRSFRCARSGKRCQNCGARERQKAEGRRQKAEGRDPLLQGGISARITPSPHAKPHQRRKNVARGASRWMTAPREHAEPRSGDRRSTVIKTALSPLPGLFQEYRPCLFRTAFAVGHILAPAAAGSGTRSRLF